MAFSDELEHRWPGRVTVYARDKTGTRPDLARILAGSTATVYCCGPASMTEEVAALVAPSRVHVERFTATSQSTDHPRRPIEVTCNRSRTRVHVSESQSLLEALELARLPVYSSCREGVCGACEVRVLAGHAEHLDSVPGNQDKDALGIMYPCVSRAHTPTLTLDI